jgi:hypothetical protein
MIPFLTVLKSYGVFFESKFHPHNIQELCHLKTDLFIHGLWPKNPIL